MTLADAHPHKSYCIQKLLLTEETPVMARMRQLGFVEGMHVRCEAVAPWLRHPFLMQVRGMSIALSRQEALLISVEELT